MSSSQSRRPLARGPFAAALLILAPLSVLAQGGAVGVLDPYARAVPPGQPNSAVFMTLTNDGTLPRALVAAASPVAQSVELHNHVREDGMMRMRQVERIEIPPGQHVALAPGGLHVMLIGLKDGLAPGDTVDLSLSFDDGSTARVQAPVRAIAPPAGPGPAHR